MLNHIFLFILDAVRKDHLSLYGYQRKTTPNIDKLAKQSDVYQWAFAPSSYTLASVPSILAGKYPTELSNLFTGGEFTKEDFEKLLSYKKQGYKLAMFTANIVTSHHHTNLYKFFDYFWDNLTEQELNRKDMLYQKAEVLMKEVKDFVLKNKKEKLFVVIHLMEAHGPYTPWIESIFKNDSIYKKDKRKIERVVNDIFSGVGWEILKKYKICPRYQLLDLREGPNGEIEDFNPNINEYIAKYDMGIYLMDKELGEFFKFLQKIKLFNSAKIIITTDHGELLGEENIFFTHGLLTHPALTNVPLVIKNPYQNKKNDIIKNFSLIQIINNKPTLDETLIFHPQSFSFLDNDFYINIHNAQLSHNGTLGQNIFVTYNVEIIRTIDNFTNLINNLKITIYKKDERSFSFKKIGQNYKKEKILYYFQEIIKFNFENLRTKIIREKDEFQLLSQQLSKKDQEITALQNQINTLNGQLQQKNQEIESYKNQLNQTLSLIEIVKKENEKKNRKIRTLENQLRQINEEKRKKEEEERRKAEELEKENESIRRQIEETKIHIQNLESTLTMIKSAKFFKLWQGYNRVLKFFKLKR